MKPRNILYRVFPWPHFATRAWRRPFGGWHVLVLVAALAAWGSSLRAETPPWPDSPFTSVAGDQGVGKVLAGFAQTFGIELVLDPQVNAAAPAGSGRLQASSPVEFLNQFCASHGLVWYYHAGALHISRIHQRISRPVGTRGLSGATLRRALTDMGLLETKFGWSELEDRGVVIVTGPPSYVERIERALAEFSEPLADQQLMLFRLRHASVEDRTIVYRDQKIITPGVASILRNLIAGTPGASASLELQEAAAPLRTLRPLSSAGEPEGTAAPAQGMPASADGRGETGGPPKPNARPANASSAGASAGAGRGSARNQPTPVTPSVQADPRLNAVLVRDRPQNAALYQRLIEMLDVPSDLIEIEAMIVDVNSSSVAELGVDWGLRIGRFAAGFGNPDAAPDSATLNVIRGNGVNPTTIVPAGGDFLMARIRALEGKGNARVVSRPSILTLDNLGALIDLSDTFYIQTTGERVATVTPVSVGVTLKVTPRVIGEPDKRSVQLVVDIEDGTILDTRVGQLPTVRRSTIGTQALMNENESLLIGGFNTEQSSRQRDQVPLLGDIPGLGQLFSRNAQRDEKRERLFLITPRIVTGQRRSAMPALAPANPTSLSTVR